MNPSVSQQELDYTTLDYTTLDYAALDYATTWLWTTRLHDSRLHDSGLHDSGLHDSGLHDSGLLILVASTPLRYTNYSANATNRTVTTYSDDLQMKGQKQS